MNEKEIGEAISKGFDAVMETKLMPAIGEVATMKIKSIVDELRREKNLFGTDKTGLTDKQKMDLAETAKAIAFRKAVNTKANEALIEEQDGRGGFLVSRDVANAIMRIAASVGVIMGQAQKWELKTDELGIPNYTGAFLTGEYLGVDAAGTTTGITFGQALLIAKKWQLAFVVGNDLLADASTNLADWLLAIAGEGLANMIDKQGTVGTAPFIGLLKDPNVPTYTLASGKTTFASFNPLTDASTVAGQLEESVLDGAAWYMHRTVWAAIRSASVGNVPLLPFGGVATPATLQNSPTGGGVKPIGEMMGYPVFTIRHLPDTATGTQNGVPFMIFGNMKAFAFGDKGDMSVSEYTSGVFGTDGKEIGLKDQRALVYKQRHALVNTLPKAFVTVTTSAS